MMPYLYMGILVLSMWIALRSIGGLISDQSGDAGTAANNRVERHRGLNLAAALTKKANLLAQKALDSGADHTTTDAELAKVNDRITQIEAERAPLLQRETHREQRLRGLAHAVDVVLALIGIAGVIVAIGGFISLAF